MGGGPSPCHRAGWRVAVPSRCVPAGSGLASGRRRDLVRAAAAHLHRGLHRPQRPGPVPPGALDLQYVPGRVLLFLLSRVCISGAFFFYTQMAQSQIMGTGLGIVLLLYFEQSLAFEMFLCYNRSSLSPP